MLVARWSLHDQIIISCSCCVCFFVCVFFAERVVCVCKCHEVSQCVTKYHDVSQCTSQ